jgi:hypothetical protein
MQRARFGGGRMNEARMVALNEGFVRNGTRGNKRDLCEVCARTDVTGRIDRNHVRIASGAEPRRARKAGAR